MKKFILKLSFTFLLISLAYFSKAQQAVVEDFFDSNSSLNKFGVSVGTTPIGDEHYRGVILGDRTSRNFSTNIFYRGNPTFSDETEAQKATRSFNVYAYSYGIWQPVFTLNRYGNAKVARKLEIGGLEMTIGSELGKSDNRFVMVRQRSDGDRWLNINPNVGPTGVFKAGTWFGGKVLIDDSKWYSAQDQLKPSDALFTVRGEVVIGTNAPDNAYGDYKLGVDGIIVAKELTIQDTDWADYVFEENYDLTPLAEVKSYISKHKHLPNVPSQSEIAETGLKVSEMQKIQMEKIEELMLYMIQLKEQNEQLVLELETLKNQIR